MDGRLDGWTDVACELTWYLLRHISVKVATLVITSELFKTIATKCVSLTFFLAPSQMISICVLAFKTSSFDLPVISTEVVPHYSGAPLQWCPITVVPHYSGAPLQWYPITVVPHYSGAPLQWCPITVVPHYSGTPLQWYPITVVPHYSGTPLQWYPITVVPHYSGTPLQWYPITVVPHYSGTPLQWYPITVVPHYSGTPLQWYPITVVPHYSGTPLQWYPITVVPHYSGTLCLITQLTDWSFLPSLWNGDAATCPLLNIGLSFAHFPDNYSIKRERNKQVDLISSSLYWNDVSIPQESSLIFFIFCQE